MTNENGTSYNFGPVAIGPVSYLDIWVPSTADPKPTLRFRVVAADEFGNATGIYDWVPIG